MHFKILKSSLVLIGIASAFFFAANTFAAWNGDPYSPGQTLNPECGPTDPDCNVQISIANASSTYSASGQGLYLDPSTNVFTIWLDGNSLSKSLSGLKISDAYAGQSSINTLGTVATGTWQGTPISSRYGGTGVTTTPTNGQLLIGNGSAFSLNTLSGSNGIVVSNGAGTIGLSFDPTTLPSTSSANSGDLITLYDSTSGTSKTITKNDLIGDALGGFNYQGSWNANTNVPDLSSLASTTSGTFYIVSTAGTTTLGGVSSWSIGDWAIYNGTSWEQVKSSSAVSSVFGRTGIITAHNGDYTASQITNVSSGSISSTNVQDAINELASESEHSFATGTLSQYFRGDKTWQNLNTAAVSEDPSNLYYTDSRARNAFSAASGLGFNYSSSTGTFALDVNRALPFKGTTMGDLLYWDGTSWTATSTLTLSGTSSISNLNANSVVTNIFNVSGATNLSTTSITNLTVNNNSSLQGLSFTNATGTNLVLTGNLNTANATIGSLNGILFGTNGSVGTVSTSSLGINTDNLVEGTSNLFFTNLRADNRAQIQIAASTSTVRNFFSASSPLSYNASTGSFGVASGFNLPSAASTTAWNAFYSTPSSVIAAGTNLSWNGNTLNADISDASASVRGLVSTSTQSFAGDKTFVNGLNVNGSTSLATTTISNLTVTNFNPVNFSFTNATSTNLTLTGGLNTSNATIGSLNGLLYGINGSVGTIATSSLGLLTTNVAEGSNLYFTNARADARIAAASSTIRGFVSAAGPLSYDSATGIIGLMSGYSIPLTASSTEWSSAYQNQISSASSPLSISNHTISLSTAGDWGGTFDGQEGSYYLNRSNQTGTQPWSTIVSTPTTLSGYGITDSTPASRTISASGSGISGGGDLSANRSFSLDFNYLDTRYATSGSGVLSFNGRTGAVSPQSGDYNTSQVSEGSNLYYTDARADARVAAATSTVRGLFSASSPLSYNSSTGSFGVASGFDLPLSASTTAWNTFYSTPSSRITAGSGLAWSGNTLNSTLVDASASTSGTVSTSSQSFAGNKTFLGSTALATTSITGPLTVSGSTSLATTTVSNLTVTNFNPVNFSFTNSTGTSLGLTNTLSVLGTSSLATTSASALTISGNSSLQGLSFTNATGTSLNLSGNLNVGGISTLATTTVSALNASSATIGSLNGVIIGTNGVLSGVSTSSLAINTDNLVEGTNNLFFTNLRADNRAQIQIAASTSTVRNFVSSSATGLTYTPSTGIFSLTAGYNIPLTASTTAWQSFYSNPSSSITAGTGLAWNGNSLSVSTSTLGLVSSQWITSGANIYYPTGNVGIGTSTPLIPLSVLATASQNTGVNTTGNINGFFQNNIQNLNSGASASSDWVATANNGDDSNHYIDMGINGSGGAAAPFTTANHAYLYSATDSLNIGALGAGNTIQFFTTGGTSPVERMRIDALGNVGIGSTTPLGVLTVKGLTTTTGVNFTTTDSANVRRFTILDNGNVGIGTTTPGSSLVVNGNMIVTGTSQLQGNSNCTLGLGTNAAGNLVCLVSDARLKNVDYNYVGGLDAIEKLQPVVYNWKPESGFDPNTPTMGFIAQDVGAAIPEAFVTYPDGVHSYNQLGILGAAVNAIKELNVKVKEMASGIFDKIFTKEVHTDKLCVGDTCVTEDQLKEFINEHNTSSTTVITPGVTNSQDISNDSSTPQAPADSASTTPTEPETSDATSSESEPVPDETQTAPEPAI